MSFFSSAWFVALFMSSPIWLGIIAYLARSHRKASQVIWSYAFLLLWMDILLFGSQTPSALWSVYFSLGAIWYWASSIISAVIMVHYSNEEASTWGFVIVFILLTLFILVIGMQIPGWITSLINWIVSSTSGLWHSIARAFLDIVGRP